jgi:thymidylate kinase
VSLLNAHQRFLLKHSIRLFLPPVASHIRKSLQMYDASAVVLRGQMTAEAHALLSQLFARCRNPVVLLREVTRSFYSHVDDLDLLLTESDRTLVLNACLEASINGQAHFRISAGNVDKVQLQIWNVEATCCVRLDLWTGFTQLITRKGWKLTAEQLIAMVDTTTMDLFCGDDFTGMLKRLPADIELALLVLHWSAKRRLLTEPVTQERLESAFRRLQQTAEPLTTGAATASNRSAISSGDCHRTLQQELLRCNGLVRTTSVPAAISIAVEDRLVSIPGLQPVKCQRWRLRNEVGRLFNRLLPIRSIVGSDGSGKSTILQQLKSWKPLVIRPLVAKKYYRRSISYRLLTSLTRRNFGISKEQFDDTLAPVLTLRAAAAQWSSVLVRLLVSAVTRSDRKEMWLDRSVTSFLITQRKSDTPRLAAGSRWIEWLTMPATTILLAVPFSKLVERKQESTDAGHAKYQQLLSHQALRQYPTDLVLIANSLSIDASIRAITAVLEIPVKRSRVLINRSVVPFTSESFASMRQKEAA